MDNEEKIKELEKIVLSLSRENYHLKNELEQTQKEKESEQLTFIQLLKQWLEIRKMRIKPTTYAGYELQINKHIIPYFANKDKPVTELTAYDLEQYYQYKLE